MCLARTPPAAAARRPPAPPDFGGDDFEARRGGLRRGPRQLVRRASRIATVADSFRKLVAHLPVHPSGPCRQRGYDATAGACYAATSGVTVSGGSPDTAAAVGAPERERGAPVCFPENPTVCYRPMPRRYGLGASDYGVGRGNRNDRKSSTDCARLAAGWRTDVR